jgi:hypothetical protein
VVLAARGVCNLGDGRGDRPLGDASLVQRLRQKAKGMTLLALLAAVLLTAALWACPA